MKKSFSVLSILFLLLSCQNKPGSSSLSVTSSQIYGGVAAAENEWLSAVAILLHDQTFCTGVLVSSRKVLTAAHCAKAYEEKELKAYGTIGFGTGEKRKWKDKISIAKVEFNADYDDGKLLNQGDFAMVTLAQDAPSYALPMQPISADEVTLLDQNKQAIILVGFGQRESGMSGQKFKTQSYALEIYRKEFGGGLGDGKGACHGDSGGPAYVQLPNGDWRVFGLTSRGEEVNSKCTTKEFIYSRVDVAMDWYKQSQIYQQAIDLYNVNKDQVGALKLSLSCADQSGCNALAMKILDAQSDWNRSLTYANMLIENSPNTALITFKISLLQKLNRPADEIQREKNHLEAFKMFETAVTKFNPRSVKDTINQIDAAVAMAPDFSYMLLARAKTLLAIVAYKLSNDVSLPKRILDDLNNYIKLNPKSEEAYMYRYIVYTSLPDMLSEVLAKADMDTIKALAK